VQVVASARCLHRGALGGPLVYIQNEYQGRHARRVRTGSPRADRAGMHDPWKRVGRGCDVERTICETSISTSTSSCRVLDRIHLYVRACLCVHLLARIHLSSTSSRRVLARMYLCMRVFLWSNPKGRLRQPEKMWIPTEARKCSSLCVERRRIARAPGCVL